MLSGVCTYSCRVSGEKKKGEAAVLGLCLSLVAEGLANDFFLSVKKNFQLIWYRIVVNKEWVYQRGCGSWVSILSPSCCPAPVCGRIWCCSCRQLCCAAPPPKMFAPIVFADVIDCSNMAELWPHNTSCVTTDFYFQWMLKLHKQKEFVFFAVLVGVFWHFCKCSLWRNFNILEHHSHTHIIRLIDTGRGWQTEGRTKSSLWTVLSLHLVEVTALRGIAGHPCISGFVQTPSFLDVDKMLSWPAHVNSQQCKNQR